MINQELEKIYERITKLNYHNQLTFGIMLSQSLMSNYISFFEKRNYGNPKILLLILDILKLQSINKIFLEEEIENINEVLHENTPHMDEFSGDIYASLALDCCSAIGECIDFTKDKDLEHIKNVAYISTQSIQFFITYNQQLNNDLDNFDQLIFSNNLMQTELKFQNEIIDSLTINKSIDKKMFDEKAKEAPSLIYA